VAETGLVIYESGLNLVPLRKFKPIEMNFFWCLIDIMKDEGNKRVFVPANDVKRIIGWTNRSGSDKDAFQKYVKDINKKLASIVIEIDNETECGYFTVFSSLIYSKVDDGLYVRVSEDFVRYFNELVGNAQYTRFITENMMVIRSGYAKELFRQLMAFHSTGWRLFKIKDFRDLLQIPDSYQMSDVDKRILEVAKKELTEKGILESLDWRKESDGSLATKGRAVTHIKFYFKLPKSKREVIAERQDQFKPDAESEAAYLAYQNELYGKDYKIEGQSGLLNYYDKDEYQHQQGVVVGKSDSGVF
jgi:plasmid replication initiation protein